MKTFQRTFLNFILALLVTACGAAAVTEIHASDVHTTSGSPATSGSQASGGAVELAPTAAPAVGPTETPPLAELIEPTDAPSPTAGHVHVEPSPTSTLARLAASPTPEYVTPVDLVLLEPAHQSVTKNALFKLSWQAYPGAAYYEVLLLHDHAHAFLDHERVNGTAFAFTKAQQDGDYDWVVEAFNAAGEKIASSPVWYFTVEP